MGDIIKTNPNSENIIVSHKIFPKIQFQAKLKQIFADNRTSGGMLLCQ
jgi:hypothetical protein